MDMRLALAKGAYGALIRQIEADAALLARMGVMDYSLLLGVHYPRWGDQAWYPPGGNLMVRPAILRCLEAQCSLDLIIAFGRRPRMHDRLIQTGLCLAKLMKSSDTFRWIERLAQGSLEGIFVMYCPCFRTRSTRMCVRQSTRRRSLWRAKRTL